MDFVVSTSSGVDSGMGRITLFSADPNQTQQKSTGYFISVKAPHCDYLAHNA